MAPPPIDAMAEEEGADRLQRAKVSPSADSLPEGGDETRVQRVKKKRRRLLEETEEAEMVTVPLAIPASSQVAYSKFCSVVL